MKKIIPVLIAVFMIIVIAVIGVGARLMEKYSYSKERADLTEYFEVRGEGDVPVILWVQTAARGTISSPDTKETCCMWRRIL